MDIIALDKAATLAINSISSPFSDSVWMTFSARNLWFPLYAIVAACLIWKLGWKKGLVTILSVILTIVCCDQFANFTKEYFARLRPCEDPEMVERGLRILVSTGGGIYGFYSAHAANAMGFALCSYLGFRYNGKGRYRIYGTVIIIWSILVGLSRIFVGKHFLGDVTVGFIVGIAVSFIMAGMARRINRMIDRHSQTK